ALGYTPHELLATDNTIIPELQPLIHEMRQLDPEDLAAAREVLAALRRGLQNARLRAARQRREQVDEDTDGESDRPALPLKFHG
ncbi:MAG TPA: hypothetical protein VNL91_10950, partial [Thermoanaerobaculia bacterium]|nr:hypothetical protein [Thermoanaerobaculia bacterium]